MSDISSNDDSRLLGHEGDVLGVEVQIHSAEFDVHLEGDVLAVLFLGAADVAVLDALGGDAEDCVYVLGEGMSGLRVEEARKGRGTRGACT